MNIKINKESRPFDDVIYDIVIFLSKWLTYHILDTNKRIAKTIFTIESKAHLEDTKKQTALEINEATHSHIQVGTNLDITQRELGSLIYKNSSQGILVSDSNNNIISVNPAFFKSDRLSRE